MTELVRSISEDCPDIEHHLENGACHADDRTPTRSHPPQATHCHPARGNQCSPRRQRSGYGLLAQPYDDGADVAGAGPPLTLTATPGNATPRPTPPSQHNVLMPPPQP